MLVMKNGAIPFWTPKSIESPTAFAVGLRLYQSYIQFHKQNGLFCVAAAFGDGRHKTYLKNRNQIKTYG